MDKFEQFRPDEETIECWVDAFEARLLCHNIQSCDKKRHWCQALVGEAGRNIIKKLPQRATWDQIKQELFNILGETNPKDLAFDQLLHYKPKDKGLGEIATDIMTKATKATQDEEAQNRLGLKAFLSAVPENIRKQLRRRHFRSVREALEEARFLQRVEEEETPSKGQVYAVEQNSSQKDLVEECLKQLQSRGIIVGRERQGRRKAKCWCCGEEGHFMMQCPTVRRNRTTQNEVVAKESGNE